MDIEWIAAEEQTARRVPVSPGRRRWASAVLLAVAFFGGLFYMWNGSAAELGDSAATTTTIPARTTSVHVADASTELKPVLADVVTQDVLAIAQPGQSLLLIDLSTGDRTALTPPEPMVSARLAMLADELVVVGHTMAWRVDLLEERWEPLGEAFDVMPSSFDDRVWLATAPQRAEESQNRWNEVDKEGNVVRSVLRTKQLPFDSPELVWSSVHLYKMADEMPVRWQTISSNAVPMAYGRSDLVLRECANQVDCSMVWYNLRTQQNRGPLFDELASNIPERNWPVLSMDGRYLMSMLSPDQRFVAQPTVDTHNVVVTSIVSGHRFETPCRWDWSLRWSSNGEIIACRSDLGIDLYETATGKMVATAQALDSGAEAYALFVP